MRSALRRIAVSLTLYGLAACAESSPNPVTPKAPVPGGLRLDYGASSVWNMADLEADFGGVYSLDTTSTGQSARFYMTTDATTGDETFCRDHFNALDLWWDGGYGLMSFHMDPPLLFVGYRAGTYTSPRRLIFRKAIYETLESPEATDPAGNVWRFHGRFNALCRGGEFEIGPIVFGAQIVVAQDPVDRPVLVRTACSGGPGNGGTSITTITYDPYDDGGGDSTNCGDGGTASGSGIQYQPGDNTGGETVDWNTGVGNGGTSSCGPTAVVDYVCIDIWDGVDWKEWSCGYATTC